MSKSDSRKIVEEFDSLVKKGMIFCGVKKEELTQKNFGVAVSGGADSISLLTSLSHFISKENLFVVTVNHNLRPAEETEGDAFYVESYCKNLNVNCTRFDVPRGKIISLSKERGMGVEEAARFTRYDLFETFIIEKNISFLSLAHNQNDQIETVVMRFLKGAGSESLSGIPFAREKFIRPLLNIPRDMIEEYLKAQHIEFRTDKTNFDSSITRNFIRNELMALLDKKMFGWKKAVLSVSKKSYDDDKALNYLTDESISKIDWKINLKKNKSVSFNKKKFSELFTAVQRRILFRAIEIVGAEERVPYSFVEKVCSLSKEKNVINESVAGIECVQENELLYIRKKIVQATERGFFVIIERVGEYKSGPWIIKVSEIQNCKIELSAENCECENQNKVRKTIQLDGLKFPFAIRSKQPDDEIKDSSGSMRSVSRILAGCKKADDVPVVQELSSQQKIICIWKSLLGEKDWIVKN